MFIFIDDMEPEKDAGKKSKPKAPRLRTADKTKPPYLINKFPPKFINRFGEEIVYLMATKNTMSIEGEEWEEIFARCVGAKWTPSNIGLQDVQLGNCCWSAKTVKGNKNLTKQKEVRLISGRNSTVYSYEGVQSLDSDPEETGRQALAIWNGRVGDIRNKFVNARTVVLVKGKDYSEYLLFEIDTILYQPENYYFKWHETKKGKTLWGFEKGTDFHKFTWQPSGSQFTIIEKIPKERYHLRVRKPEKVNKEGILKQVNYDSSWVEKLD